MAAIELRPYIELGYQPVFSEAEFEFLFDYANDMALMVNLNSNRKPVAHVLVYEQNRVFLHFKFSNEKNLRIWHGLEDARSNMRKRIISMREKFREQRNEEIRKQFLTSLPSGIND